MWPNKTPEPMRVIAVSSASRLDVGWSRMAQLRMLARQSERCLVFIVFFWWSLAVVLPRHELVVATNHPSLEFFQFEILVVIHHRVWRQPHRVHRLEAIHHVIHRLARPVAAQEIDHDVCRADASISQQFDSAQKDVLILAVVPCRVDAFRLELVVAVFELRQHRRAFGVDEPDIDSLIQRHLEVAREQFIGTRPPFRLPEEVVIEQDDLFRVSFSAPDFIDGRHRLDASFFLRHDTEGAFQTASALREAERRHEIRINGVVVFLERFADVVLDGGCIFRACSADDAVREVSAEDLARVF